MRHQTIAGVLFAALCLSWSVPSFAQSPTVDPYTTTLGLRYDAFSHAFDESSGVGFSADVTRMIGGFTHGGGWGAGGSIEFEHFESSLLKEFEGYVAVQGKATGQKQLSPFGRIGIGLNSDEGFNDMMLDFRGGIDFKLRPDSPFLVSAMVGVKHVFAGDLAGVSLGYTVVRFSGGIVLPLNK